MSGEGVITPIDRSFYLQGGDIGVVLIHGLTGTPVEMRYVGKALHKAGCTVHGLQLPGHCGTEADLVATRWTDWAAAIDAAITQMRPRVRQLYVGGLSMGAVLSLHAATQRGDIDGLLLYGPTLWYDGWSIPWYSFLLKALIHTPIGRNYRFLEQPPYGIKDERLRRVVIANMQSGNSADAGLEGTPATSVQQLWQLVASVRKQLHAIKAPTLILHAADDDISSVRNARFLRRRLGGPVEFHLLDDCYHMITVDRQRDKVVDFSLSFIAGQNRERDARTRMAAS